MSSEENVEEIEAKTRMRMRIIKFGELFRCTLGNRHRNDFLPLMDFLQLLEAFWQERKKHQNNPKFFYKNNKSGLRKKSGFWIIFPEFYSRFFFKVAIWILKSSDYFELKNCSANRSIREYGFYATTLFTSLHRARSLPSIPSFLWNESLAYELWVAAHRGNLRGVVCLSHHQCCY